MSEGILARRAALVGVALLLAGGFGAASARAQTLSAPDAASVQRAVAYLDGLATASGRFSQTNARGQTLTGTFTLQRPGKARFDYDPPSGLVIASDGGRVVVVDNRLKTIRATPLAFTPLGLFLSRHIRLDRGVRATRVERTANGFSVTAQEVAHPNRGQITLDFLETPLRLSGWAITEAGGGVTRVRLANLSPTSPKPASFFVLKDPKPVAAQP